MEARFRLLGAPAVHVGSEWLSLEPTRPGAVIAYLAHRGSPVRRSEVATLLWTDRDETRASANLRQAVKSVAEGPLGGLLGRDRSRLWLHGASDVALFEAAVRECRWQDAVQLYRGALLEGFELDDAGEFGSWLESERTAVAGRWRQACTALIGEAEARGDHASALRLADMVIQADSLDEVMVRHALTAAGALGDRAGVRRRYESFRAMLERELGIAPDAATLALAAAALAGPEDPEHVAPDAAANSPPHTVVSLRATSAAAAPGGVRQVLGRDELLTELQERLASPEVRLLTLLAPGGMGKTTVALEFAREASAAFPDGVIVVNLEAVEGRERLVEAVARAAGLHLTPGVPLEPQVVAALGPRRAVLVLDAFERHLDATPLVDGLVRAGQALKVLVTSRVRLRHSLEMVVEVGPLATQPAPRHGERIDVVPPLRNPSVTRSASDAARLFLRVAARQPDGSSVGEGDLERIEAACRALGGTPLAIELAAAWAGVMPLAQLVRRVEADWELLSGEEVDRPPRQRDVSAILAETWLQLAEEERTAWARLAVMPGTLDRAVAATVAGSGWRGLRRLLDRSIVRRVGDRLELHALLGRFGRERAEELGQVEPAWDAALEVWRERAPLEVEPATGRYRPLTGDDLSQAVGAWRRAVQLRDWDAVVALSDPVLRGLERASRLAECSQLVQLTVPALERGRGPARDVALARLLPHVEMAGQDAKRAAAVRARQLARRHGDHRGIAQASEVLMRLQEGQAAFEHFARARAGRERAGDDVGMAFLLTDWADAMAKLGWYEEALRADSESLVIARKLGDSLIEALALDGLTTVPLIRGEAETVRRGIDEARKRFERVGACHRALITLATESWLCAVIGDHERSLRFAEAFIEGHRDYGDARFIEAMMHTYSADRRGDHETVMRHAPDLLRWTGAPERASAMGHMAQEALVHAHAARGQYRAALECARASLRMIAELGAPGPAASSVATVGLLAEALGERRIAVALLERAWHHPSFGFAQRGEVRAALERLGISSGEASQGTMPASEELVELLERSLDRLERVVAM